MVLESIVTALFNKYLGPYVENLDGSQLVSRSASPRPLANACRLHVTVHPPASASD